MRETDDTLTEIIASITAQHAQEKHGCIIIHGGIGTGKTRLAERLAATLRGRKITVGGIISPRILSDGETIGYRARDIDTGAERLFATLNPPGIPIGKFYLSEDALAFALTVIERASATAQVVLLDEVGRLELAGKGHAIALRTLLQSEAIPVLFVRTAFVDKVARAFGIIDHASFPVD